MSSFTIYPGPKSFLESCGSLLETAEMQNNLLLGNCYNIILENREYSNCYFLDAGEETFSVKVSAKIALSGDSKKAIKEILDFYTKNEIAYTGVIGPERASSYFAELNRKKIKQKRTTLIQELEKVNDLHLAQGSFEPSRLSDLPVLKKWVVQFFEEENLLPKKSTAEAEVFVKNLMKHGNLFSWIHEDKIVSMAAIIRRTKNTAIIGLVYTPPSLRGNGFAKSCVHGLSDYILKKGFRKSGLLVYESNSTARRIYEEIGYRTVSGLLDIDFE